MEISHLFVICMNKTNQSVISFYRTPSDWTILQNIPLRKQIVFFSWHAWLGISHSILNEFGSTFAAWTFVFIPFHRQEEKSIRYGIQDIPVITLDIMSTSSHEVLDRNKFREYHDFWIPLLLEIFTNIRSYYANKISILWRMLRKLYESSDGRQYEWWFTLGWKSLVTKCCWAILVTIWN